MSHARAELKHLPDGPEQRARDASLAGSDPLVASGWIMVTTQPGRSGNSPPMRTSTRVTLTQRLRFSAGRRAENLQAGVRARAPGRSW